MKIGIIGAGSIAGTVGQLWARAGHDVRMADSKGNAVVVGYGSGVGEAVARAFATEGFSLALLEERKLSR